MHVRDVTFKSWVVPRELGCRMHNGSDNGLSSLIASGAGGFLICNGKEGVTRL